MTAGLDDRFGRRRVSLISLLYMNLTSCARLSARGHGMNEAVISIVLDSVFLSLIRIGDLLFYLPRGPYASKRRDHGPVDNDANLEQPQVAVVMSDRALKANSYGHGLGRSSTIGRVKVLSTILGRSLYVRLLGHSVINQILLVSCLLLVFTPPCLCFIPEKFDVLSEQDFTNAEHLLKDEIFRDSIPIETVNDYKSDIRGPVADRKRFKRNGVSRTTKLWPQGKIPYAISPHYTTHERALLARAVKQYHEKTCIRFVPRVGGEGDYLFIGKVDGCFSEVGRTSGVQVLSLDNGCMEYATIIHEMMHVVGFYHEHERWDRDAFIDIIWQNIDRGALDQFGKVDLSKTSYYGQPYDYKSILHYDSLAFSKNGFPTMLPKKPATTIGNAKDFSDVDLAKINRMYKCDRRPLNALFGAATNNHVHPIYSQPYVRGSSRPSSVESNLIYDTRRPQPNVVCEDKITITGVRVASDPNKCRCSRVPKKLQPAAKKRSENSVRLVETETEASVRDPSRFGASAVFSAPAVSRPLNDHCPFGRGRAGPSSSLAKNTCDLRAFRRSTFALSIVTVTILNFACLQKPPADTVGQHHDLLAGAHVQAAATPHGK
ncbi:unnamed protein product [Bursaphelenchus okinawaensis]|uniref:Metalloendopeptidase n=1 Tax=Bursaphelenchus okinawaensis TaxID=465554 RepID=A0A811KI98_9BILA|nr:unnamed protein product [Bursaphelenchus okinawaensis]CAG9103518.1 unnamed protein product [Bursaphelenchus okinawaensis]